MNYILKILFIVTIFYSTGIKSQNKFNFVYKLNIYNQPNKTLEISDTIFNENDEVIYVEKLSDVVTDANGNTILLIGTGSVTGNKLFNIETFRKSGYKISFYGNNDGSGNEFKINNGEKSDLTTVPFSLYSENSLYIDTLRSKFRDTVIVKSDFDMHKNAIFNIKNLSTKSLTSYKYFKLPLLTRAKITELSVDNGMMVYQIDKVNTDLPGVYLFKDNKWIIHSEKDETEIIKEIPYLATSVLADFNTNETMVIELRGSNFKLSNKLENLGDFYTQNITKITSTYAKIEVTAVETPPEYLEVNFSNHTKWNNMTQIIFRRK